MPNAQNCRRILDPCPSNLSATIKLRMQISMAAGTFNFFSSSTSCSPIQSIVKMPYPFDYYPARPLCTTPSPGERIGIFRFNQNIEMHPVEKGCLSLRLNYGQRVHIKMIKITKVLPPASSHTAAGASFFRGISSSASLGED